MCSFFSDSEGGELDDDESLAPYIATSREEPARSTPQADREGYFGPRSSSSGSGRLTVRQVWFNSVAPVDGFLLGTDG
jgi:hypothetical protein